MRYFQWGCTYTEAIEDGKHTYTFTGPCMKTGKPYSVTIPAEGLYRYNQGVHIQEAFPDLSDGEREFLMTGYSPEGWKLVFPEDQQDEDGDEFPDETPA